jgi:hypothetical protein
MMKSVRGGRSFEARLDSAESIPWALGTMFAFEGRIRPHNECLPWST